MAIRANRASLVGQSRKINFNIFKLKNCWDCGLMENNWKETQRIFDDTSEELEINWLLEDSAGNNLIIREELRIKIKERRRNLQGTRKKPARN